MQVIQDALHSADLPYGVVATIGNYDGIHRGQRSILQQVVERARERQAHAVAISFDPHPVKILRPERAPKMLTIPSQRERLMADLGLDALLLVRFNSDLARTEPEDFVRQFLAEQLDLKEVFVGSHFSFGKDRRGNVDLLRSMGQELGFTAHGVDEMRYLGEVISSTRIRQAVDEGRMDLATELLGRPYSLRGKVVRGDRMGARLGWPTINLMPDNELLPQNGVYVGRATFDAFPGVFECVTNVGTRPTVYENYQCVVESHILGFKADVYGEVVEVEFCKRLREEKMFSTVMDLSAQIRRDVESTREFFAAQRRLEDQDVSLGDDAEGGEASHGFVG